jgi:hypothetical protein
MMRHIALISAQWTCTITTGEIPGEKRAVFTSGDNRPIGLPKAPIGIGTPLLAGFWQHTFTVTAQDQPDGPTYTCVSSIIHGHNQDLDACAVLLSRSLTTTQLPGTGMGMSPCLCSLNLLWTAIRAGSSSRSRIRRRQRTACRLKFVSRRWGA